MKKLLILTFFTMLTFSLLVATYGIFESDILTGTSIKIAAWEVTINDSIITNENKTFDIDDIIWEGSENVLEGKVAPGMKGYFDIAIDPKNTDVAIRYDILYNLDDLNEINSFIKITNVEEINNNDLVLTSENTYTGLLDLNDIENKKSHIIRTHVEWIDDENNSQNDYLIGISDEIFKISIDINVTQYLGEEIKEYVGE